MAISPPFFYQVLENLALLWSPYPPNPSQLPPGSVDGFLPGGLVPKPPNPLEQVTVRERGFQTFAPPQARVTNPS